jgi:hypothetical protein
MLWRCDALLSNLQTVFSTAEDNSGQKMAGTSFWASSLKIRITYGCVEFNEVVSQRLQKNLDVSDKIFAFSFARRDKVTAVSPHLIPSISRES